MRKHTLLAIAAITLLTISCSKEKSNPAPADLLGTYDFISASSTNISTVTYTYGNMTEVSKSSATWASKNSTGTLTIDSEKMTTSNFGYTIEGESTTYIYENNKLIDSVKTPISMVVPPSSSSGKYKVLNSNTLRVDGGTIDMDGQTIDSEPTDMKFKKEGGILTLSIDHKETTKESSGGITMETTVELKATLTFKEK